PVVTARSGAVAPARAASVLGDAASAVPAGAPRAHAAGEHAVVGGRLFPVTHAGNFALPPDRGDFGSGAVDVMGESGVLMALGEDGGGCVGFAPFHHHTHCP